MASLTVVKGQNAGTVFQLKGDSIILGRNADCQVVINVPAVSREHALIRKIEGKYYIEDMKSRNSTFVNNQEVTTRTPLKDRDRVKICDNIFEFIEVPPRPPLPVDMRTPGAAEPEEEDTSSTVEATFSSAQSGQILVAQPAEKLAVLLNITGELTTQFNQDQLLPKIADSLFQVFKQADRAFIILAEDNEKLIPKVVRTRRGQDDTTARFSRKIVKKCMDNNEALLSEDATTDKRFDLSQSIADCRIRSVMCAPMASNPNAKAIGVIQLDTQDRLKKFTQDDLKLLMSVAGQAAIAIENARMHQELVARAGIERDLQLAHQVQLSFLPKRPPVAAGYEFHAHYESAHEVGGDYYDFIPLPDQRIAVMVGDVAGKGVPAALLMAKVSSDARYCMLTEKSLATAITKLNELMQEAGLLDRFVTLAATVVDPLNHEIRFVSAGHVPPVLYRAASQAFENAGTRDAAGLPLGVADGFTYEETQLTLEPGDGLVIFTDGVTDARNKQNEEFPMERVLATLKAGAWGPRAMGDRLVTAVKQHQLGCKQFDDITVVAFGRLPV